MPLGVLAGALAIFFVSLSEAGQPIFTRRPVAASRRAYLIKRLPAGWC